MANLRVSDFSCVSSADIALAGITVLIGPQASGKSVLSKLVYFFNDALFIAARQFEDKPESPSDYLKEIGDSFKKWFPVEAWGKKRFDISYRTGALEINIKRTAYNKKPSQNVKVTVSEALTTHFSRALDLLFPDKPDKRRTANQIERFDEKSWRIRNELEAELRNLSDKELPIFQLFVPAGRAFFTSFGRAATAFEHGGMLDQPTIRFGRFYASSRDRVLYFDGDRPDKDLDAIRKTVTEKIVGGEIRSKRDAEFVESKDGRKVPFSFLSSGQQEVIPLLQTLEYFTRRASPRTTSGVQLFIEEPEAHLFPTSQAVLTEYLVQLVSRKLITRLLITTHSPYLLTKLNNLLKAGVLANSSQKPSETQLASIVARDKWISPGSLNAYSIGDGQTIRIVDEEGHLSGDFLDEASVQSEQEFSRLLGLQYGKSTGML